VLAKPNQNSARLKSTEIAQQDDIAADFPPCQKQLFSISGPVKIEDSARGEFRYLPWRSARQGLLPEVCRPVSIK
jgi:hypothetical protein